MAHLGDFTIDTNREYKKVSDLTGIVFEDDKQYIFQIQNSATVISSAELPQKGGFYISTPTLNLYTKKAGEDLYIKTGFTSAVLNIAE